MQLTSPKAPLPITLTVRKSSSPSFVRRSLRKVDSFLPCCKSCRCFRSSDSVVSVCSRLSSSTRLVRVCQRFGMKVEKGGEEPCISLDSSIYRYLVVVLEFKLGCFSARYCVIRKRSSCSVKVHVICRFGRLGWRGFRRPNVLL